MGTGAIQLQAATLATHAPPAVHGERKPDRGQRRRQPVHVHVRCHAGLEPNGNNSLALSIGGNTDGATANLGRSSGSTGTLVIAASDGTAALGATVQVTVAGSGGNLPALTNGMVAPYIVAQNNDSNGSGDFLTYSSSGFAKAAYSSATTDLVGRIRRGFPGQCGPDPCHQHDRPGLLR